MGHAAPQLHAPPDGREGSSRRRRPTRPGRSPSCSRGLPGAVEHHRALLRRGSAEAPRAAVRRAGALRGRALGPDHARLRPPGGGRRRWTAACATSTSGAASASRQRNVAAEGRRPASTANAGGPGRSAPGDIVPAVVLEVAAGTARARAAAAGKTGPALPPGTARVRVGKFEASSRRPGSSGRAAPRRRTWSRSAISIEVEVTAVDEPAGAVAVTLEQTPLVEGALLAIDNRTGQIRAMVGGFNFDRSKFNRAVQAPRQIGSTFKPIVYTAAIDRGYTPASLLVDAPVSYTPGPASRRTRRRTTTASTRARSRCAARSSSRATCPTVKLMEQLGPAQVISYARRFGFQSPLQPYLSIGARRAEATLLEVTSAYSAFPEPGRAHAALQHPQGHRPRRQRCSRRHRPERARRHPRRHGVRDDEPAAGVVAARHGRRGRRRSTGRSPARPARSTTTPTPGSSASIPNITVGVWVGYDEKKPLGPGETGAAAALPIWMDVHEGLHRPVRRPRRTRRRSSRPATSSS